MIVWLDAQLPPALAPWMAASFGVQASSVRALSLRDAADKEIFAAARQAGAVLVSKDSDFVDMVQRLGPPPQLLWLTCGNVTNEHLRGIFNRAFPRARALIEHGSAIVEIADSP